MKINQSHTILEQAAAAIQRKLTSTTLPGITPTKVTALAALVANAKGADTDQSGGKKKASTSRLTLDELMDAINKGRRKILFAVEAAWPSDAEANGPIRREFGLTADRPFVG